MAALIERVAMKFLALVAFLLGAGAFGYAGFEYTREDRRREAENPSAVRLAVPFAFAASMAMGGVLLWVVGGKASAEATRSAVRPRIGTPENRVARARLDRLP
jgi:hypothetical protein